ncbi:MAG TPA: serine/threonine-protein kinase [Thermoanaerobaculia bacterium]|jgi:serine/threonine-protein kinase
MTTPAGDPDKTVVHESSERSAPRQRGREAQFAPGTIVAGRYRIAGLLGAGGMGEVYRADDTKLDQPVALKFLPARLARDHTLLSRLHDEVRLGRQVAHPNVCRIYDIVDDGGSHFVAMEYVDGEDLSRLLRRIGRLAHDKAVDIARGIAAGLMAAHAKGILHRDLKPANVMVDSRGEARIMDFGLALAAGEDDGTISGTPAYMAPEQLEGQPATVQSDLYALGLVMYELFTGKRAHAARTLPERVRELTSDIAAPSSVVRDMDPSVERLILRCLANEPSQRPHSAREVIHALPGGDPLAAALAAGETPSPRIVAAAGAEGSLSPRAAWSMLAAIALMLVLFVTRVQMKSISSHFSLERSPEVLEQRASDVLRALGVPLTGEPRAYFQEQREYTSWLHKQPGNSSEAFRKGPAPFVYRLHYGIPAPVMAFAPDTVNAPGYALVEVDPHGRLHSLLTAPEGRWPAKPLDWRPLLDAAGLDVRLLRPVTPRAAPAAPFDARAAWTGTYPGDKTPIRVEAAAWQGRPVFFRVGGPWDDSGASRNVPFYNPVIETVQQVLMLTVWGAALFLAWRNLRLRRGDRQGALRVAGVTLAILAAQSLLRTNYSAGVSALTTELSWRLGQNLFNAGILFLTYIALEPFMRRRWPEQLIAWARLVGGRVRDPLVGRHVLIGILGGLAHLLIAGSAPGVTERLTGKPFGPYPWQPLQLQEAFAEVCKFFIQIVEHGFTMLMVLVLITLIVRSRPVAVAGFFVVTFAFFWAAVSSETTMLPVYMAVAAVISFVTVRYGLLAIGMTQASFFLLLDVKQTGAPWLTLANAVPIVTVIALAIWAFHVSLAGQPAFSASLLDE